MPLRKSLVSVKGSAMKNGGAVVPENVASHEVFFFWDSFLVGAGVKPLYLRGKGPRPRRVIS